MRKWNKVYKKPTVVAFRTVGFFAWGRAAEKSSDRQEIRYPTRGVVTDLRFQVSCFSKVA